MLTRATYLYRIVADVGSVHIAPQLNAGVNMSTIFRLSSLLVLPFWGLMILLPRWRWTTRILRSRFVIAALAALYTALALPRLAEIWPGVSRPTLDGVAALLGSPAGATIAWIHFLAFDLFVGRWIYLDSQERGISSWIISPLLFLTLMFGPLGFLSYLIVRTGYAVFIHRKPDTPLNWMNFVRS